MLSLYVHDGIDANGNYGNHDDHAIPNGGWGLINRVPIPLPRVYPLMVLWIL